MAMQGTICIAPGNLQRWRAEAIMLDSRAEQRGLRRYALRAQVTVRWSYGSTGGTVLALVRDISENGVFLYLDSRVPEGANIEFMLSLPTEIAGDTQSAFWCKGRVVRVEAPLGAKSGIGARIEQRKKVPRDSKLYQAGSVSSSDAPLGGLEKAMVSAGKGASHKSGVRQASPSAMTQVHHSEAGVMFFAALVVLAAGLLFSVFAPPAPKTVQSEVVADPDAKVWVHTRTGQYYCEGTPEFGKLEPGKTMSQHDAQAAYYRAAAGVCQ
ncbi:MAG TPA: PilZ domain-containing protein [Terriglobales bacterium]|nr:PilZ domain-containing protein [Terriglobales bacterium]